MNSRIFEIFQNNCAADKKPTLEDDFLHALYVMSEFSDIEYKMNDKTE